MKTNVPKIAVGVSIGTVHSARVAIMDIMRVKDVEDPVTPKVKDDLILISPEDLQNIKIECNRSDIKMIEPNPITYRMLHEGAAGYGLIDRFFTEGRIDPDATVVCNCHFDEGHERHCDLVAAQDLRRRIASWPAPPTQEPDHD